MLSFEGLCRCSFFSLPNICLCPSYSCGVQEVPPMTVTLKLPRQWTTIDLLFSALQCHHHDQYQNQQESSIYSLHFSSLTVIGSYGHKIWEGFELIILCGN